MLKDYQSKPVTRKAHKIEVEDKISKVPGVESTYILESADEFNLTFKAYEEVAIGDYVVYLTSSDIYHCSAKVFHERNIVEAGE